MPELQVCSVVNSILAAFGSGMDVFQRMAVKKSRKQLKASRTDEAELWLQNSLSQRPKEIKAEYDHNVAKYGHSFQAGDAQAHSSLAHTLLLMNAGLIEIINHALSSDAKARIASRQSLLNLSELAAMDTLNALSQLSGRLNTASQLQLATIPTNQSKPPRKGRTANKKSDNLQQEQTGRPVPSPLLARGGWVRSKSGSTVVSAAAARKKTQKDVGLRSQSMSAVNLRTYPNGHRTTSSNPVNKIASEQNTHACVCSTSPVLREKDLAIEALRNMPSLDIQQRPPSMLIVPSDYFETFDTVSHQPPPRPPKIPIHSRPNPNLRARPVSSATFMTASTKIGEIPEYRLPDRVLSPEEQAKTPLPYVIPPPLIEQPPKKLRGFKLWKKQIMAAC